MLVKLSFRSKRGFSTLALLDDAEREVLFLAEIEQLTVPEIASALDISTRRAGSRFRLARARYDRLLADVRRSMM